MNKPLVSCYTVIGRNVRLLDQWVQCVRSRADYDNLEINLVLWDPAPDIVQYTIDNNIRTVTYKAAEHTYNGAPCHRFVLDLYNCFNLGYEMSRAEYVFRSGSDQIFSKGFIGKAMELILPYEKRDATGHFEKTAFYHQYTMESWDGSKAAYGNPCSRHIMPIGWWDYIYNPRWDKFDGFCEAISTDKLLTNVDYPLAFRHATKGWVFHTVGASWIQRRDTWERLGPLWTHVGQGGLTGDVEYFDRGDANNIPSLLLHNSFTLHRCKGELS